MRVRATDLERAYGGGQGAAFEDFVYALVHEAARQSGVSANAVDWDPRPNVADGGRDIVVRNGHPGGSGHFIPDRPSHWSLKSGADGVSPATLRREIEPPPPTGRGWPDHPKVRDALRRGDALVWCAVHAVTHDARDAMRAEADRIAADLGVSPGLIEFRWQDQLVEAANRHPNVIARLLPHTADRWAGVETLREWERGYRATSPWANFGGRADLVTRVAVHLLGRGHPNVLHVVGLSGIGKTRVALEACRRHERLGGVLYIPRCAAFTPALRRAVEDADAVSLVVDETSFSEAEQLRVWFADRADQVRIVALGPAARQRAAAHPDLILVPEPQSEDDVLAVIREPGRGLSDGVLRSIAARSAHDLRLALRLVEATARLPELRSIPVVDAEDVWDRLMTLFPTDIPDPRWFRTRYEILTVAIDVGFNAEYRGELQALAGYFGLPERELLDCLNVAERCGLGLRAGRFFEATPHALAEGLFQAVFRRLLRDRMRDFMESLPDRLSRRFLERCQELPDDLREEVADPVGRVFLGWLRGADITTLAGREASRIFQSWAEFDPARGLAWLRRAVEDATPAQLLGVDGATDGSGKWRGRRQLVWLCQNLAGFAEHFAACEAVLYRLARYETEPQIGNNGTALWRSLFWPVLTPTELAFDDRFPVLLGRLQAVTADDLELVLGAVAAAVDPPHIGFGLPPRVVGGRLTPAPWMPATHAELAAHRRAAARQVLAVVAGLSDPLRDRARRWVIGRVQRFGYLDVLSAVRALFLAEDLPADLRRELVVELDRAIGFHRRKKPEDGSTPPAHLPELEAWRAELAAGDLATRVQDLTAREYHDLWMEERSDAAYEAIGAELIAAPDVLGAMRDWLGSDAAKGARPLGFVLGRRADGDRVADIIRAWLTADTVRPLVLAYLGGLAARAGELPPDWASDLDTLVDRHPELAIEATTAADRGTRGLERILGAVARMRKPVAWLLRGLLFAGWGERLSAVDRGRILAALVRLASAGESGAVRVGLEMIDFWWHDRRALDAEVVQVGFELAALGPGADATHEGLYHWQRVLGLLAPHDPGRVAELVVELITGSDHPWRFGDENAEVLAGAARSAPREVMEVIGQAILDPARRVIFGIDVFHGVFEAVGVDEVRRWVETHGSDTLPWVARHLASPAVDQAGEVVVPPVTDWLFTERAADREAFEWFLMGRHSGVFVSGDNLVEKRKEAMAPFLSHQSPRVREWAEYEVGSAERHAEWFERHKADDERV